MNIQHLEYALEVAKTGSISKAAENLYMGQPNLSKAIRELEATLGFSLFTRTSKGASVTTHGQEFMRYARSILHQMEEIESIGKTEEQASKRLRLCVPRSSYISDTFSAFVAGHSAAGTQLMADFRETNSVRAIQQVADERCEVGIIRYQAEHAVYFDALLEERGLEKQEIWTYEYQLLLSQQHPLAAQSEVPLEQLADYVEIMHGDLSVPYNKNAVKGAPENTTPGSSRIFVYERGSQFDLLAKAHRTYMWVAPMPGDALRRNGLTVRPCHTGVHMKDALILRQDYRPSEMEDQFLQALSQTVQTLAEDKSVVSAKGFSSVCV